MWSQEKAHAVFHMTSRKSIFIQHTHHLYPHPLRIRWTLCLHIKSRKCKLCIAQCFELCILPGLSFCTNQAESQWCSEVEFPSVISLIHSNQNLLAPLSWLEEDEFWRDGDHECRRFILLIRPWQPLSLLQKLKGKVYGEKSREGDREGMNSYIMCV